MRRWRKETETIGADRTRRSAKDIRSIGASLLRRWRKDTGTICADGTRRSAKHIRPIAADILRLSKNSEMNRGASLQRSPKATSRLFSNPWRPNTQARPRNIPPTQRLLHVEPHCRICLARVNHNGGAIPSFGHSVCAIRPRPRADIPTDNMAVGECGRRSKAKTTRRANYWRAKS